MKKLRILVVEDNPLHIEAARQQLASHDLTIVSGYDQASEQLNPWKKSNFDVVLTDVMIPKGGNECMSPKGVALANKQEEMPYGPVIALKALSIGVKRVGILTSGNHHDDPFVFAFDRLPGFKAGDTKVSCSNNLEIYIDENYAEYSVDEIFGRNENLYARFKIGELFSVKNWKKLLCDVMSDETPEISSFHP